MQLPHLKAIQLTSIWYAKVLEASGRMLRLVWETGKLIPTATIKPQETQTVPPSSLASGAYSYTHHTHLLSSKFTATIKSAGETGQKHR